MLQPLLNESCFYSRYRHKVELVGGIGPTVGKVMYLNSNYIDIWIGCRLYEVFNAHIVVYMYDTLMPL